MRLKNTLAVIAASLALPASAGAITQSAATHDGAVYQRSLCGQSASWLCNNSADPGVSCFATGYNRAGWGQWDCQGGYDELALWYAHRYCRDETRWDPYGKLTYAWHGCG